MDTAADAVNLKSLIMIKTKTPLRIMPLPPQPPSEKPCSRLKRKMTKKAMIKEKRARTVVVNQVGPLKVFTKDVVMVVDVVGMAMGGTVTDF